MRPVSLASARRRLMLPRRPRGLLQYRMPGWLPAAAAGVAVATLALSFEQEFRGHVVEARHMLQTELGFASENLVINGAVRTSRAEILEACAISPGGPILELDVHAARERLEALPWVRQASVRRRLPDTLVVDVQEHAPLAIWLRPEGSEIVSPTGASIRTHDMRAYADLPRLVGADAPRLAGPVLRALQQTPEIKDRLRRLEHRANGRWRLYLEHDLIVELPLADPAVVLDRLALLHREYGLLDKALSTIDLRLADRVVVAPLHVSVATLEEAQ